MKRTIIEIDEEKCNGCGLCVSGCHEGALQLIDGKARLISDLFCDGLGACIGECPEGAITLTEREAEPYDEIKVMQQLKDKGEKTILAHLRHLAAHGEMQYVKQGIAFIKEHGLKVDLSEFETSKPDKMENQHNEHHHGHHHHHQGGCPGSKAMSFEPTSARSAENHEMFSELRQWPVQLHLLNPAANYFRNADVLLAADCTAFAIGAFHSKFLKGKTLAIACPKLDSGTERYIEKIKLMIEESKINTLTVMIMEVPCCGGLLQMAKIAAEQSSRKVPIKLLVVSLQGEIIKEEWI